MTLSLQTPTVPDWLSGAQPLPNAAAGLRRAAGWLAGLVATLFALILVVPVGSAVIAPGMVRPAESVQRVAHPVGGVIRAILVKNGDRVQAGQPMIALEDRVTGAEAASAGLSVEQLLAQHARLEAERIGSGAITFPAELIEAGTAGARKAMDDEAQLFRLRRNARAQERSQISARAEQYRQAIHGLNEQMEAVRQQRTLIEPERRSVRELWDKRLVTIGRLNQLERTAVDLDGSLGSLRAQVAQVRARIAETGEQASQIEQQHRAEAASQLVEVNAQLNMQRARAFGAGDAKDRSVIRAPSSGVVEQLAYASVGEVVRPIEPVAEIIPDSSDPVIEMAVPPSDVDRLARGQTAQVRFSAFDRAATPEIAGTVVYIAANLTLNAQSGARFYLARIALDRAAVRRARLPLRSGMPAEVHIATGARSLFSYLTKPLRDQFARAFRD